MIFTEYYSRYLYELYTKVNAEKDDDDEDDDDEEDNEEEDPDDDELLLITWKNEKVDNVRR
jgi:hypothetical protein